MFDLATETAPRADTRVEPKRARLPVQPREVLTLRLGGEEYAIDILRVQEIRSYEPPTRIAGAPPHVLGVTDLRGVIVPIVDVRLRLGLEPSYGPGTVMIVLNVAGRTLGAVVDAVSDVITLDAEQIRPPPEFSPAIDAGHITGIATVGDRDDARMLIVIDIEAFMAGTALDPATTRLD